MKNVRAVSKHFSSAHVSQSTVMPNMSSKEVKEVKEVKKPYEDGDKKKESGKNDNILSKKEELVKNINSGAQSASSSSKRASTQNMYEVKKVLNKKK